MFIVFFLTGFMRNVFFFFIGTYAREDLEKMIGCKINLKLWVKVNSDWMNNESLVKKFKLQ